MSSPSFSRCAPFAAYMLFIALDQGLRAVMEKGIIPLSEASLLYLYPVKSLVVAFLLIFFFKNYEELRFSDWKNIPASLASCAVGVIVFALWIRMAWTIGDISAFLYSTAEKFAVPIPWTHQNSTAAAAGYDPYRIQEPLARNFLIFSRLAGASLIVPVMEELFWRSFLLRYLINNEFTRVAVGTFTWGSFLAITLLFGAEHDYLLAGMMAGIAYNLLAVYTRSIAQCVLAHGVTNLILGIYVLTSGKWQFW
jgi:uncharacterized protein